MIYAGIKSILYGIAPEKRLNSQRAGMGAYAIWLIKGRYTCLGYPGCMICIDIRSIFLLQNTDYKANR